MQAADFLHLLEKEGFDFFSGVPCSYFTPLCDLLAGKDSSFHIAAVREDIAVGLCSGAYLTGKMPLVYMQNSGLGYCLEAFASLPMIYRIPMLALVSYRGPQDQGMEEHLIMGQHTEELLKSFKIKYSIFTGDAKEFTARLREIEQYLLKEELPYFLLFNKGALQ
ncbi:MAG: sulfopyruvate decarboxylase subunit alpha [Candidatus Aminicenantes bacterium]|nr:sulfopyruvate decarboxylase subunit alpha [Candidatus Aminicenantes bacterium]